MATIIGVGMQMTASAAGMTKGLSEADRALKSLQGVVDATGKRFEQFADSSTAAAQKQQQFATDVAFLNSALRTGQVTTEQYRQEMAALVAEAQASNNTFQRGVEVTQQFVTAEERRVQQLAELDGLLKAGAISEETYARARAQASGAAAAATEAEQAAQRQRAALAAEAARITESVVTEDEKRLASLEKIQSLLDAGLISEETYERALAKTSGATAAAAEAERHRQSIAEEGRRVAESFATVEERRAAELERLQRLLDAGVISEETYARARAEASGANAAAAEAERQRAAAVAAAGRIIQANLTPQERYDAQIQELRGHLDAGRLTQDQFNRAAAKAKTDLDNVGASATKTDKAIDSLNKRVGILATIEIGRVLVDGFQLFAGAITSATNQVISLVSSVSSSLDSLNDLSARTGIAIEELQGYSLAAKLAGVDVAEFGSTIQRLAVNIGRADPGGAFEKSLQGIGLTLQQLRGLNPEQQFAAIGDAISQLPTAADRAAAAVEIFGKQGAALAPLFREGAASIDELRERAERLGIIVSETQINNVAAMNDAFDLVRATVEGIIGQVIGNLAPAVTEVANQFLEFVETFQGVDGTGGTGIANAITDVLLQGAEALAGVFDYAVAQLSEFAASFGDFSGSLETTGDVFGRIASAMVALSETFRAVFNIFELAGNAIAAALGKVLEGIGSYVSSELEIFGQELQRSAKEATERNSQQLKDATNNANQALQDVFTGAPQAAQEAAESSAVNFMKELREKFERERSPEFRIVTNTEELRKRFQSFFKDVKDEQGVVTAAMQEYEAAVAEATADGVLLAEEIARIEAAQKNVNSLLDQERANRQAAADAAKKQADEDERRVAGLLKTNDAASKVADDLAAVERERQRVAASQDADAESRLRELDALRGRLLEQQQALAQGFGDSFADEFLKSDEVVAEATRRAEEFGDAGAQAAADFANAVAVARQRVELGLYSKEQYDQDIQLAQDFYNKQLEAQKKLADDRRRVNEFVDQQLALQAFGGDSGRLEAARRVLEIEAEIARVEQEMRAAREAGEDETARAAATRLAQLDQVAAKERDIATGAVQAREEAEKRLQEQQDAYAKAQEEQQKQVQQQQQAFQQELARQQQAEYERQVARITELNTLGSRQVNTADVRTQEGAALVLNLAASAQDPALIESRLQSKYLKEMNENIRIQARRPAAELISIVGGGFLT